MEYREIELLVARSAEGRCTVRVLRSDAGQASAEVRVPDVVRSHAGRGVAVAAAGAVTREGRDVVAALAGYQHPADPVGPTSLQELGVGIFDLLLPPGQVRALYRTSLSIARDKRMGLRVRVRTDDSDLASTPWEYAYDAEIRTPDYLALTVDTPVTRYVDVDRAQTPLPTPPRVRVLGVTAAPHDLAVLNVAREREVLQRATEGLRDTGAQGRMVLDWLEDATPDGLHHRLARGTYHVLHFIGHGTHDSGVRNEGGITLCGEDGKACLVSATDLTRLVRSQPLLRLVVLNACHGADERSGVASVATRLIGAGVPAVIAMQRAITDAAAIRFAGMLYDSLACAEPLDLAVTQARIAMTRIHGSGPEEWGTPVLYLSSHTGRLFTPATHDRRQLPDNESGFARRMTDGAGAGEPRASRAPVAQYAPVRHDGTGGVIHAGTATAGLHVMVEMLRADPGARDAVVGFRQAFRTVARQLTAVAAYKQVHDQLHTLQFRCYNMLVSEQARFAGDADAAGRVSEYATTLEDANERVGEITRLHAGLINELEALRGDLDASLAALRSAVAGRDAAALARATRLLRRILDRHPSSVNTRLNTTARELQLDVLVTAMRQIVDGLKGMDAEDVRVRMLAAGAATLVGVDDHLHRLVGAHDQWQALDNELRLVESQAAHLVDELELSWPKLSAGIGAIADDPAAPAYARTLAARDALAASLAGGDAGQIRRDFTALRRHAGERFHQVDVLLLKTCEQLDDIARPVNTALEVIQ